MKKTMLSLVAVAAMTVSLSATDYRTIEQRSQMLGQHMMYQQQ